MRDEYNFSKGKRGAVIPPDPNKVRITIRLDADIISYFKELVVNISQKLYFLQKKSTFSHHLL